MNWISNYVRPRFSGLLARRNTPENLWIKDPESGEMVFHQDLERNQWVVPSSGYHMHISAKERLRHFFDPPPQKGGDVHPGEGVARGRYTVIDPPAVPQDPLKFRDERRYIDKLKDARSKTGQDDTILIARGLLHGVTTIAAVHEYRFMGGSLGLAAGEAIVRAAENAVEAEAPMVVFTASGGARMQEGILSLMQLPRTTVAVEMLHEARLPYIVVLTNPTTGGVSASYAMLGDVHIAEPGALICFAGPRVIEQTIREKLPEGFQRAEYLEEHGMVDMVVPRTQLRETIGRLVTTMTGAPAYEEPPVPAPVRRSRWGRSAKPLSETALKGETRSRAEALIEELSTLHPKGYDLSLGRIRRLLERLDHPERRLPPVVHVAGTNGKGSTIAFLRAILEAGGLSVHAHTSPHLVRWHERYRLGQKGGGEIVEDAVLAEAIARVARANGGEAITVFEILTAVAFVLFADAPADMALIEVGLGGRFDATNVVDKALAIITPVGLDHMAHLGDTTGKIAFEKAGILRAGVPLVLGVQDEAARDAIDGVALPLGIDPFAAGQDFQAHVERGRMVYQDVLDGGCLLDLPLPSLVGPHQVENAATAIAAARVLAGRGIVPLGDEALAEAIERGVASATWPARLQRITRGPLMRGAPPGTELWLDGGHNPHAAAAVAHHLAALAEERDRPLFMVAGMLDTKEPGPFFATFAGLVRHVFTVPLASTSADIAPAELARIAGAAGLSAEPAESVADALATLYRDWEYEPHGGAGGSVLGEGAGEGALRAPRVLLTGSLYLAGEVLAAT